MPISRSRRRGRAAPWSLRAFDRNRQQFFERMDELVSEAKKGEINRAYAIEHFHALDQVNPIVPTSSNSIDLVEFRSHAPSQDQVTIDEKIGDKLRTAHRVAESAPRQVIGAVIDINDISGTMVIIDDSARQ